MSIANCCWAHGPGLSHDEAITELLIYGFDVESSYDMLSDCWDPADETATGDVARYGDQGLLTDARSEDRLVICRKNHSCESGNSCRRQKGMLSERVSVPIHKESARLFRCSQIELPDFIEWLSFQHTENYNIYQQPSPVVFEGLEHLSDESFNRCSSAISQLLQSRTVADLQLILLACYFVTNSLRRLNVRELECAVREIAKTRFPGGSNFMMEEREIFRERELLRLTWTILRVDRDLNVTFAEPSMAKFLKCISLPGIERGHATMAQMCLGEIRRFGSAVIVQPWHRFRKWFSSSTNWPLMRYATKYWSCHVREASPTRPDVTAELFHIINHGVANKSPSHTPIHLQRRVVEFGYNVSKIYDLPCLTQLYQNLGAVGDLPIVNAPTSAEWQHLKPISHHSLPSLRTDSSVRNSKKAQSKTFCHSNTGILSQLEALQISCQGRPASPEDRYTTSEIAPEDVDWERIDARSNPDSFGHSENDRGDSWNIVTHEDYATC